MEYSDLVSQLESYPNLKSANNVLEEFKLNEEMMSKLKFNDEDRQKYLLYSTNDYAIFAMAWKKYQHTNFHQHASNGCLFKVIIGGLMEIKKLTGTDEQTETIVRPKGCTSESSMVVCGATYIDNSIGCHKIISLEDTISFHVYSPCEEALIKPFIDLRTA